MHIEASYCDISEREGKEKVLPTSERQEKRENSFLKETGIRIPMGFSAATLKARRQWKHALKILREDGLQATILHPIPKLLIVRLD